MFKKTVLILSSIIVLSLPFQQQYAEGAIFSKVASKGAQKIVKEVIKESAFDIAVDMFVNEAYKMAVEEQAKYKAQSEYELFCGKKMPDLITCEKPMQVKKVLTSADKTNIGNQAEIELDKLITNGKGFTRWQKFLDWFLPIWVASFALTAITYAIDPEVRSLFNEAGYNALVALGIIKPVETTTEIKPLEEETQEPLPTTGSGYATGQNYYSLYSTNSATNWLSFGHSGLSLQNTNLLTVLSYPNNYTDFKFLTGKINDVSAFTVWGDSKQRLDLDHSYYGADVTAVIYYNGQPSTQSIYKTSGRTEVYYTEPNIGLSAQKIKSIMHRSPYKIGNNYYTDVLFNTVDGNTVNIQISSLNDTTTQTVTSLTWGMGFVNGKEIHATNQIYTNKSPNKQILVPLFEETELQIPKTKYENDSGEVALIPPSALPYTQTSTGTQLTPEIDETTGEQKFTTPTGESVPEDDITVGEPNVQDNPSPAPNTVTPPATQTNPNPEPIPLTPTTPTTPPNPPPDIETLPPVFPEGESCEVGLKLPKISPLAYAVSEAFPFSIPFDLYDGFQAIFSEMGNEKPEFAYKLNFMGEQQEWKISIPDYFDSWKRFTDSFLIFVFDVGIIFMIFRFMGGSK